jgi:outer membrane protein OmpU
MKKVLLATSALFLTAGVASAELTFSGTAGAGVIKSGDVRTGSTPDTAGKYQVYSGIDINVTASATADNGMVVTATTDIGGGALADVADKEINDQGNTLDAVGFTAAYNGVTVALKSDGQDDLYDDDQNGDVKVSGSMGGLNYAIVSDTNDSEYSYSLGFAAGDVSITAVGTSANDAGDAAMKVSAAYTMGDLTATLTSDNKGADAALNTVAVAYKSGALSLTASATNGKVDGKAEYDLGVSYVAGAATVSLSTDESSAWEADVAYDLGGGVSAVIAGDHNNTILAGMSFAF